MNRILVKKKKRRRERVTAEQPYELNPSKMNQNCDRMYIYKKKILQQNSNMNSNCVKYYAMHTCNQVITEKKNEIS